MRAKESEIKLARIYYVEQGMTAKDIAELLGRKATTIGNWAKKHKWKEARDAMMFSDEQRLKDIKEIISSCATERIQFSKDVKEANREKDHKRSKELRMQMSALGDEVAKWNKTLVSIQNADRVTLSQRIQIHDEIFTKIRQTNPKIYKEFIFPIQEQMLQDTIKMYD